MKRYSPALGTENREDSNGRFIDIDDMWEWLLNTAHLPEKEAREIAEDFCEELGIKPARKRFA